MEETDDETAGAHEEPSGREETANRLVESLLLLHDEIRLMTLHDDDNLLSSMSNFR